jgi:Glutamate-cysteine ligase
MMQFAEEKSKEMNINLDKNLLKHLGFLFKRDALVMFENKIEQNDKESTAHFESI